MKPKLFCKNGQDAEAINFSIPTFNKRYITNTLCFVYGTVQFSRFYNYNTL